jgi:hypothetical protein
MTVDTNPILAYPMAGPLLEEDNSWKATPAHDKACESQNLLDRVDLASFPPKTGSNASGIYEKSLVYQEDLSAVTADTKIEYEGKDGSNVFIHFSYVSISRKVHYVVVQTVGRLGDIPEAHPHPVRDYFGPQATAERILRCAKGLVNKFRAMEGDDKEKLGAFIQKLINAIDKAFGRTRHLIGTIPHHIGGMIHETHDLVLQGMTSLRGELLNAQGEIQTKLTYDEEIAYTSASLEISVMA